MYALKFTRCLKKDGVLSVSGLPCAKGEIVEVIVLRQDRKESASRIRLADTGIVGIWKHRSDIEDSSAYARSLRNLAQNRSAKKP